MKRYIAGLLFVALAFNLAFGQVAQSPYTADILAFKKQDSLTPPQQHAILFIGSSSFTRWKDVKVYFPGYTIINRAYGGSTLVDQVRDVKDIVYPYNPRQIVIYCGENDFAQNDTLSPRTGTGRFKHLYELIRSRLPEAKITYVSMKPSPSRWKLADKFVAANREIRSYLRHQPRTSYVDVWKKMLAKDHKPIESIFLQDQLHMNATGYHIWQKAIKSHLIK